MQNASLQIPSPPPPGMPHGLRALTLAASKLRAAATVERLPAPEDEPPAPVVALKPRPPAPPPPVAEPQAAAEPAAANPAPGTSGAVRASDLRVLFLLSGAQAFLQRRARADARLTEDEAALVGAIGAELERARDGLLAYALEEATALIERPSCAGRIRRTADGEPADLESLALTMARQTARLARSTLGQHGAGPALATLGLDPEEREPVAILTGVFASLADLVEGRIGPGCGPAPVVAALVADLRARIG